MELSLKTKEYLLIKQIKIDNLIGFLLILKEKHLCHLMQSA